MPAPLRTATATTTHALAPMVVRAPAPDDAALTKMIEEVTFIHAARMLAKNKKQIPDIYKTLRRDMDLKNELRFSDAAILSLQSSVHDTLLLNEKFRARLLQPGGGFVSNLQSVTMLEARCFGTVKECQLSEIPTEDNNSIKESRGYCLSDTGLMVGEWVYAGSDGLITTVFYDTDSQMDGNLRVYNTKTNTVIMSQYSHGVPNNLNMEYRDGMLQSVSIQDADAPHIRHVLFGSDQKIDSIEVTTDKVLNQHLTDYMNEITDDCRREESLKNCKTAKAYNAYLLTLISITCGKDLRRAGDVPLSCHHLIPARLWR